MKGMVGELSVRGRLSVSDLIISPNSCDMSQEFGVKPDVCVCRCSCARGPTSSSMKAGLCDSTTTLVAAEPSMPSCR